MERCYNVGLAYYKLYSLHTYAVGYVCTSEPRRSTTAPCWVSGSVQISISGTSLSILVSYTSSLVQELKTEILVNRPRRKEFAATRIR